MPAKALTPAFIDTLTWNKALRTVEEEHQQRHRERHQKSHAKLNEERRKKGEPELPLPPMPPAPALKPPVQIAYLDKMERGLSLMLVLGAGGTKAFRALTYRNGKPQSFKLGTYPTTSLKQAKAKARDYFENPRKLEEQATVGTFKEIAENWVKRHVEGNGLLSGPELKRHLKVYVYPRWAERKFLDIRRRDVNDLLDHLADNHGLAMADAVLATLSGVMTWHQSRDENYTSPIVKGMRRNQARKARERILNDNEIHQLWPAAEQCGTVGALVQLLLLTAQRKDKVNSMRWDDLADGEWTIRRQAREKGTAGKLLLPPLALDVLARVPHLAGNPHVFAGRAGAALAFSTQRKRQLDQKLGDVPHWTLHDLRRTARSLMSRAGVRPDIAERVLGHAITGVEGVYDRHLYDAEKAEALVKLAALVERIVHPPAGNVVVLAGKPRRP